MKISQCQFCLKAFFYALLLLFSAASLLTAATYEADSTPWSGYWWPLAMGGLATGEDYRGHPAPLEKYELLTTGTQGGDALTWYRHHYYDPDAVSWAGLCPSWARAAMYEDYEILPSSEENIIFRVGDKKGLLTLCHDDDALVSDSAANPEVFHRWLLNYIKDQDSPFTADLSYGEEVWYYPIYRYEMDSHTAGSWRYVDVTVFYASDAVGPDYMGTKEMSARYSYKLELENGAVVGGEWTGESKGFHPEFMRYPVSSQARCPYIDCGRIRSIARTRDDFLEAGDEEPRRIQPGTYNLVLLNEDSFVLDAQPGDTVYVEVKKQEGSGEAMAVSVQDASQTALADPASLDAENNTFSNGFTCSEPPCTIRISQSNYEGDPNIYTLSFDRKSAFAKSVPYKPIKGEWSGFALTHTGAEPAEFSLVARTEEGTPVQTVFGPETIEPGGKRLLLYDELNWRDHEYSDARAVSVLSDKDLGLVNLFARPNEALAGFGGELPESTHLVIPDTLYTFMGQGPYMKAGISNHSLREQARLRLRLFSRQGELQDTVEQTIRPGRTLEINPGSAPFSKISDGGWIDVVSRSGAALSGYQYVKDISGGKDILQTLPALAASSKVLYLPHIPPPEPMKKWITELTLINPTGRQNRVIVHYGKAGGDDAADRSVSLGPYEKRVMDATAMFGKLPGHKLYRSILRISAERPLAGYYSYGPAEEKSGDKACYPLLDESSLAGELVLSHVPDNPSAWWIGACVCNPGPSEIAVEALPYDYEGALMEGYRKTFTLEPGAYRVFALSGLFSQALIPEISYVKFRPKGGSGGEIGGFYLYGNRENGRGSVNSLSGANMGR